ncbi:MAG: transglycosylase domain-containing protein, partial [Alphaproteobacteria bacterium]
MARRARTRRGGRRRRASPGRSRRRRFTAGWFATWLAVIVVWAGIGGLGLVAYYAYDLPDITRLKESHRLPSVTLVAADGTPIARFGELYGPPVALDELPPALSQAVIATEDRRFYRHFGLDLKALMRAVLANVRAGRVVQGGSTLTQQLAKNLFLTPERTLKRKIQELLLALWLELTFTKDEIFTIYLNRVYLGAGAYGVEAAARRYFGKSAKALNLSEAAMIAGLLKAPSRYAPTSDLALARARARQVLANMVEAGFLKPEAAAKALVNPARLAPAGAGPGSRYFADWALDQLAGYVGSGAADLVVVTTLDRRLQELAERAVAEGLKAEGGARNVGEAALIALAPDGAVRAMVGGRRYAQSQFNRAAQAMRQPGSAFKLFVYLAGLENGLGPGDVMEDRAIAIDGWRPRNFDGRFRGPVTVSEAVARSINTVAVRVAARAGLGNVVRLARRLGITSPLREEPSLALGASEVTLLELTAAYGALANRGYGVWPYGIGEVRAAGGQVLYRRSGSGPGRVLDADVVAAMVGMLKRAVAHGTGRAAQVPWPAAGKTGTSQDFRDAWFVGFTRELVAGVWVGNDDGSPMRGVTGGGLPARLWARFMADAMAGRPARPLVDRLVPEARLADGFAALPSTAPAL